MPKGVGAQWLSEARLRTALLVLLALLAAVVVVRGPNARTDAASGSAISAVVTAAFTGSQGVTSASGGYLPEVGLVMAVDTTTDASKVESWLLERLTPLAGTLSVLPKKQAMIWTVRAGGEKAVTSYFKIPLGAISDPAQWTRSAAPLGNAATGSTATPGGSSATATAAPGASAPSASSSAAASASAVTTTAATSASASGVSASAGAGGAKGGDDFAKDSGSWTTISGTWAVADGVYRQDDASGYDFITQYATPAPVAFTASVRMRAIGNVLGAGLMLGQPTKGKRSGAILIDVTDSRYLRWGTYSAGGGTYQFVGGNALPASAKKGEWHTLKVVATASKAVVFWDDKNVGEIKPIAAGGVGLVTSVSSVEFDDFTLTPA